MTAADVEKLLKELHGQGVRFIIIGGMAAIAQGSAYLTADLDICYARNRENFKRLAKALRPFHARLRDAPPGTTRRILPMVFSILGLETV